MSLRKFLKLIAISLAIGIFIPGLTSAVEVTIIANKSVAADSLTKAQIKNIFLGTTTEWPDKRKITFYTISGNVAHKKFVRKYTRKSADQFRNFWRRPI